MVCILNNNNINNLSYEQRLYYNIRGIYNKIYYKDKAYKLHYGIFNVREYLYSSNIIRKHYLNLYCKDLHRLFVNYTKDNNIFK